MIEQDWVMGYEQCGWSGEMHWESLVWSMPYGIENWAVKKQHIHEMSLVEMKMF